MSKLSKDVKLLILLVVVMFFVIFLAGSGSIGQKKLETIPRRTTYSAKPGGLKAVYTTLEELGYRPVRHLEPLTTMPADGVLFITDPEVAVSSEEWTALRSWVERGNLLVLSAGKEVELEGTGDDFETEKSQPAYPSFISPGVRSLRIPGSSGLYDDEWGFGHDDSFTQPFG